MFLTFINVIYKICNVESKYSDNTNIVTGIVTDIQVDDKTIITLKAKENLIVYYYDKININLGDKIIVYGSLERLSENTNFNLFNYQKYMLSKKIYYKVLADKIVLVSKNTNFLYNIKKYILNRISKIPNNEYITAFILGDNSKIDDKIMNSYRINGISHLFSVSGMHVSLFSTIILFLLNKIHKSKYNHIFVILFLIFYMFITNFMPSIIRATLLFIFLYINKLIKLDLSTFRIILFILCLVLLINPYNIYNTGFIFSYAVSIYLILFNKIINRHKNYFIKLLITSFISALVSIPILINNYFSINLLTIFNNIVFVPFISFIIFPLSIVSIFVLKFNVLNNVFINIFEKLSIFMCKYKIEIILKHTSIFIIIIYFLVITLILYKLYQKKYKYMFLIFLIVLLHSKINYITNDSYITLLNVGQGDSIFIHMPYNSSNILIDTGGNYKYDISKDIINYLKSKGIEKLDYLLITHGDYDHMGSSIELVENFKVEQVIFNCGSFNSLESELIKVLKRKNIKYSSCVNKLNIGKYKLQFLNTAIYNNENDDSSVIYLNYNNYKFLFMGDASINREKDILKKYNLSNIDFLKVGHHGSNTSSSEEFINKINPKYSLISVGKNNRYGHPKNSVLSILKYSKIYRTDEDGSVEIKINRNGYKIKSCN